MKILIFGIDGLGAATLEKLGLRRLAKRMNAQRLGNPFVENVISRGWPELYTGKDAFQTGGFYQVPVGSRRIIASQSTGLSMISKCSDHQFLWESLQQLGYSVGLFSVPTISSPLKLDGYCVAATGAGKFGNTMVSGDFYPESIIKGLAIDSCDLGFRMGYGAFIPESLQQLELKANKHLADYFYLLSRINERCPVDACFAATRFINEMGYKFLGLFYKEPASIFEAELRKLVAELCESFDCMLDEFIEQANPDHLFIVSDHGIVPYQYELNLNELLVSAGLIKRDFSVGGSARSIARNLLHSIWPSSYAPAKPKYDLSSGSVFSIGYMNALYLRDCRFGGPAYRQDEAQAHVEAISSHLNSRIASDPELVGLRFKPLAYLPQIGSGSHHIAVPNIMCDMPVGMNNSERKRQIVSTKVCDFNSMFQRGFHGEYSGCKGPDTLASYVGSQSHHINFDKLTDVHDSIIRVAEGSLQGRAIA